MDHPTASSSKQASIPRPSTTTSEQSINPYERLSFAPASHAQILRAFQRDSSQIYRLTGLVSEVLRSLAGTRWLAHKQTIIDFLVRAVYLFLTFGRGSQTLGEEYTDILPYATRKRRSPSTRRRLLTIILLLLPSIITSPATVATVRPEVGSDITTGWTRIRSRLASFLSSPLGQSLPELHLIAFMFSGRFFEFGRRLTGTSYISTLPPKPPEQQAVTYEPLGILMLLPIVHRFLARRTIPASGDSSSNLSQTSTATLLPLSPPLTPPITPEQTIVFGKSASYDTSNTYLEPAALTLPERQCTLCLEPRGTGEGSGGTVAITECGHVFCWGCLGGLEKLECPLCRQALRMERLVAAYNL